ncbi:MAG: hypothetical protein ACFB13_00850 [Kiloniellaceae bacterium]
MPANDYFTHSRYIGCIEQIAERHGITLEVGGDFDNFRRLRESQPDRPPISPIFDSAVSDLHNGNAFWIKGTADDGELVHLQAVRLQQLGDLSLAEHLHGDRLAYAPPGVEVDPDRSCFSAAQASRQITGKVCYHGELWLKGGPGGFRGHGLTCALPRLALALAYMAWSPDFMFGLVHPLAACKGLAAREGYMHLEPRGVLWQHPDASEVFEEWLVWMSRMDLEYLLQVTPMALYEQLEGKRKGSATLSTRTQVAA